MSQEKINSTILNEEVVHNEKSISINTVNTQAKILFSPLSSHEGLKLDIVKIGTNIEADSFIVSAEGEADRKLFILSEISFMHMNNKIQYSNPVNGSSKSLVFAYLVYSSDTGAMNEELCFVDGKKGFAKKLTISHAADFKINTDCTFLCVDESTNVPIIGIYDLQNMKKIKEIQYEPYKNKGMYVVEMIFDNNAFTVTLSADTVDFTVLEIPINVNSSYHIVDSYSWEDAN